MNLFFSACLYLFISITSISWGETPQHIHVPMNTNGSIFDSIASNKEFETTKDLHDFLEKELGRGSSWSVIKDSLSLQPGRRKIRSFGHPLFPVFLALPDNETQAIAKNPTYETNDLIHPTAEIIAPVIDQKTGYITGHQFLLVKAKNGKLIFQEIKDEPSAKTSGTSSVTSISCFKCHQTRNISANDLNFQLGGPFFSKIPWDNTIDFQPSLIVDSQVRDSNDIKQASAICSHIEKELETYTNGDQQLLINTMADLFQMSTRSTFVAETNANVNMNVDPQSTNTYPERLDFPEIQGDSGNTDFIEEQSLKLHQLPQTKELKNFLSHLKENWTDFSFPSDVQPNHRTIETKLGTSILTEIRFKNTSFVGNDKKIITRKEKIHGRKTGDGSLEVFDNSVFPQTKREKIGSFESDVALFTILPHCFKAWNLKNEDFKTLNALSSFSNREIRDLFHTHFAQGVFSSNFPFYSDLIPKFIETIENKKKKISQQSLNPLVARQQSFTQTCLECHGQNQRSPLDFSDASVLEEAYILVESKEMPPEDKNKEISEEERKMILQYLIQP